MKTSKKIAAWCQYLYFLRFSVLFWWFLPVLCGLDYFGYTTSITRAFMAPNSMWQAFNIAFFMVSLQMVVLVTARNFVMNGLARFEAAPPGALVWLFCDPGAVAVWVSLVLAQIPAGAGLLYVTYTAHVEGETNFVFFGHRSAEMIWLDMGLGVLAALFFWFAVSLFYYWTYTEPRVKDEDAEKTGKAPAKPLIFPQGMFGDLETSPRPRVAHALEWPLRLLLKITYPGFAASDEGPLWELHFLSLVSLLGFFLLYLFLYPLTAPVPRRSDLVIGGVVAWVLALGFIGGILGTPTKGKWGLPVKIFFVVLALALAGTFNWSAFDFWDTTHHGLREERDLPVLASILIIGSFLLWAMSGLAFLLDRYRVPVLTTLLAIIFLPKMLHLTLGEHYFLAKQQTDAGLIPPSPAEAVALRQRDAREPLIIVTATGGGIHAAAWTTEILGRLEDGFAQDGTLSKAEPGGKPYTFHDHVLLASGVSGGSVGLMPYLLEYTAEKPRFVRERMTGSAACSSIEDVAWGLEYFDLVRLVTNLWFSRPNTAAPDRNWALTKAFNRNLTYPLCHEDEAPKEERPTLDGESLTLAKGAKLLEDGALPAFTMNTTTVETGGRFLLSNYQVPMNEKAKGEVALQPLPETDLLPSESFLHAYGEPCEGSPHAGFEYADLPIATAARLSATFPYVSSASRVPKEYAPYAYHFVDGGYYDNDGTGSVIEFLHAALAKPDPNAAQDPCLRPQAAALAKEERPLLPILLIEIRNGDDLNPLDNVDDFEYQTHPEDPHAWTALSQLSAPLGALWKAGHESVTRRNRLGLCLLETTYVDRLVIHHVVFNFDPAAANPVLKKAKSGSDLIQPLNWHLTTAELNEIRKKADAKDEDTKAAIENATEWVRSVLGREPGRRAEDVLGRDRGEACMIADVRATPKEDPGGERK